MHSCKPFSAAMSTMDCCEILKAIHPSVEHCPMLRGSLEHSYQNIPPPAFLLQVVEALQNDAFPMGETVSNIREIVTRVTDRHEPGFLLYEGYELPRHDLHGKTVLYRLATPRPQDIPLVLASVQGKFLRRILHAWQSTCPQRGHKSIGVPRQFCQRCATAVHILPRLLAPELAW